MKLRQICEPAGVKQMISAQCFSIFKLGGRTKHLMTGPVGNSEFCFPIKGLRETKLTVSLAYCFSFPRSTIFDWLIVTVSLKISPGVHSIMPKILVARSFSVPSDWNIQDHLWRWRNVVYRVKSEPESIKHS